MEAWLFTAHLGNDAEVRTTTNGVPVANFRVAIKRGWGEHERTEWVSCAWFGERLGQTRRQRRGRGPQLPGGAPGLPRQSHGRRGADRDHHGPRRQRCAGSGRALLRAKIRNFYFGPTLKS